MWSKGHQRKSVDRRQDAWRKQYRHLFADKDIKVHPDYDASAKAEVKLELTHCRFEPHIVLIRVGQTLVGDNKDAIGHNANIQHPGEQVTCALLPIAGPIRETFKSATAIPFSIVCNIHPWMKGFVLCRDNPYMAVSNQDGSFSMKQLPVGELEFQFWHEEVGALPAKPEWKMGRASFAIKAGETTDLGEIKLDPKLFTQNR